jgi:hypothetical protein
MILRNERSEVFLKHKKMVLFLSFCVIISFEHSTMSHPSYESSGKFNFYKPFKEKGFVIPEPFLLSTIIIQPSKQDAFNSISLALKIYVKCGLIFRRCCKGMVYVLLLLLQN